MNVYKNDRDKLVLEFSSQREIDALWLLTSHIGGAPTTLRSVFSNAHEPSKGLHEQLKPYVTKPCAKRGLRHPLAQPRTTSELLGHHHESIEGIIKFTRKAAEPMPAAVLENITLKDPNK